MIQTLAPAGAGGAAAPEPADPRPGEVTRFTRTVPRELVHRAAVAEVFLTGWSRLDEVQFSVFAQWPRAHTFFAPLHGLYYDPMMAAETIRQVGALLAHAEFEVPLGHHFLMWDIQCTAEPKSLTLGPTPADLVLDVRCRDVRKRRSGLVGLRYDVLITRGGGIAASGTARFTCTSPQVYHRLRKQQTARQPTPPGIPVPAPSVGRTSVLDVVLSPTDRPRRWQLRADPTHPILFDHPVDHVPGMTLLEAARQASIAVGQGQHDQAPRFPVSFASGFHRYAELGSPVWIEAEPKHPDATTGGTVTQITGQQDGETVFTCSITTLAVPT